MDVAFSAAPSANIAWAVVDNKPVLVYGGASLRFRFDRVSKELTIVMVIVG
jgi:hypothetical protein